MSQSLMNNNNIFLEIEKEIGTVLDYYHLSLTSLSDNSMKKLEVDK